MNILILSCVFYNLFTNLTLAYIPKCQNSSSSSHDQWSVITSEERHRTHAEKTPAAAGTWAPESGERRTPAARREKTWRNGEAPKRGRGRPRPLTRPSLRRTRVGGETWRRGRGEGVRLTGRPTEKACPPPPLRPSKSGVAARRKPTTGSPEAVRVAAGSSFLSHRFPCRAVTTVAVAVVLSPPPPLCRCRRPVCCSGGCLCSGPSWCVFWTAFRFEECLEKTTEIMGLHYVFLWITFFFKLLCSVCLLFSEKSVWKRIQKLYIVSIFVKKSLLVSDVGLIFFFITASRYFHFNPLQILSHLTHCVCSKYYACALHFDKV